MTSAADFSALIASAKPTKGRDDEGHFVKVELPLISHFFAGDTEGPLSLTVEIRTSRDYWGVSTAGFVYLRQPEGPAVPFVLPDCEGGMSFRLSHEVARLTEKEVARLHARALTNPKFQAWGAQTLEHFRAGGKL